MSTARKRLSCDRCHAQKLRCPRHSSANEESCGRCLRHGTKCVYSVALPKGRPRSKPESSTHGTPVRHHKLARANDASTLREDTHGLCLDDAMSLSPESLQRNPGVLDDSFTFQPLPCSRAEDYLQGSDSLSANVNFFDFSPIQLASWQDDLTGAIQALTATTGAGQPSVLQGYTEPLQPFITSLMSPEDGSSFRPGKDGEDHLPLGSMSPGPDSQDKPPPYIEKSFWGRIESQEPLCVPSTRAAHIPTAESIRATASCRDEAGLLDLIDDIPSKTICDGFIQSFISIIYPLNPLVDLPTLSRDYSVLWDIRAQKSRRGKSNDCFKDASVVTVLFAALYCGATAASTSLWSQSPALRATNTSTIIAGLKTTQSFVSRAVHTAQYLGLHRDFTTQGLNATTQELRRRIWWYVVRLDVQCSLRYGLQMHCGAEGHQWDVQMLCDPALDAAEEPRPVAEQSASMSSPHEHPLSLRFAAGTAEVVSCHEFGQADLDFHLKRYKTLHTKLATITAALGSSSGHGQGQDHMSPDLLSSNHQSPREIDEQPDAFIPWARTTLIALVKGSLMILQKAFLGHPSLTVQQNQMLWTSTFRLSIDVVIHIHGIVQLARSSAQLWFVRTNLTPLALAATFIILNHLKREPRAEHSQEALEMVDRTINIFSLIKTLPSMQALGHLASPASHGEDTDPEWQCLKAIRTRTAGPASQSLSETCESPHSSRDQSKTLSPFGLSPDSPWWAKCYGIRSI
ncbi:hypothetical protein M406DRAFT_348721 [Cryphonectria parasitica EP155]|uniref:Zn(2)-C6 fungal-type domain-containing protein n=1 Tax=Cryphonectria parasitica (strain ATCC 38755 / EP155) TaxID=660469 RepID=A0A9P4YAI3_CRYP1|nr:uncharacterized protein M406DRAFT_348721 [Cryphonectria parasitica EP155]KAF3769439.1 hypothetical protein M406DRAFT_348721 [Cryphonectria parasitica EP155]